MASRARWMVLSIAVGGLGLAGCADGGGPGGVDSGPGRMDSGDPGEDSGPPPPVDAGEDAGPGDAGFDAGVITDGEACSECGVDDDCRPGMRCARIGTGDHVCLPTCNIDLPECPDRFDCVSDPTTMVPEPVCAPVGERCCVDGDEDLHGMGVGCLGWDCDDSDPETNESAVETCDGSNNDCDGATDEGDPSALCPRGDHVARTICSMAGRCENAECELGWGDCDAMPENGCETRTNTEMHCGGCFVGCAPPNAMGDCSSGTCDVGMCHAGWGDCDGDPMNGCETPLTSLTDCGRCGVPCSPAFAIGDCSTGTCEIGSCNPRRGDCDSSPINGCETSTTSNSDCGGCGVLCAPSAAIGECSTGTCRIVTCTRSDYADCDLIGTNGCETSTRTLTDCGGCGVPCSIAGGSASCASGVCTGTGCAPGLADCDGAPGCEQMTNTNTHCGDCDTPCAPAHGTGSCATGSCVITSCAPGYLDCDGDVANGCETALGGLGTCGSCGGVCSLAHADESCASGMCRITTCDAGWGNCNSSHPDGCETPLTTTSNCAGCGTTCSRSNGTASCASGTCTLTGCNAGFSNCDGNAGNGCEVNHATVEGSCGGGSNAGTYDGDRSCGWICDGNTSWDSFGPSYSDSNDRWFRARVHEGSDCPTDIEHQVRLSVPSGIDYDLVVYRSCGGTALGTPTRSTSAHTETVTIRQGQNYTTDDSFDYYVHVVYVSGAACVDYTLTFWGHDC